MRGVAAAVILTRRAMGFAAASVPALARRQDEPIPELRVAPVDVDRRVEQMRVVPVALCHRVLLPGVERLLAELQHPIGHRDGNPFSGEVKDQRGTPFWGHVLGEIGSRPTQDLYLLLQHPDPLAGLAQLHRLRRAHPGPLAVLDVGQAQPAVQSGLRDAEVLGDLADRRLAFAGDREHVITKLFRKCLGHGADPSSEDESSQARSQPNRGSPFLIHRF